MKGYNWTARWVSNAGIVLETEGKGIGIDIFSKDEAGLYPDTPEEIRRKLLADIEAGKLHTLIFTHEHTDHFCPEDVLEAWRRNPGLRIITTEQAGRQLQAAGLSGGQLLTDTAKAEAILLSPGLWMIPDGEREADIWWLGLGACRIGFLNSVHEGAQYAGVQNLTLLVETDERRFVVPGDAAARESLFARIAGWSKEIDWFFLPFPYVGIRSSRRLLTEHLNICRAFVLHQPRPEKDEQNWVASAKAMCQRAKDGLPAPVFPEQLGERYTLTL